MAESNVEMKEETKNDEDKNQDNEQNEKPICLLMLGMAGSGKSTLVQVS